MGDDTAKLCFEKVYSATNVALEAGSLRFVVLPLVGNEISWDVPAGDTLRLIFCFKNPDDKEHSVAIKIEIPKRKGLSSTHMKLDPKDGKYWKLSVSPRSYEMAGFQLMTSSRTPRGEYKLSVYVWYSKKRTAAKAAASMAASMFLGKVGSAVAKAAIEDEKIYTLTFRVI